MLEIFDQTSFGLELETCVHIMNNRLFSTLPLVHKNPNELLDERVGDAVKAYYKCLSKKFPQVRWKLILNTSERAQRYDQWIVMPDSSLDCDYENKFLWKATTPEKYCVLRGHIVPSTQQGRNTRCKQYVFYPVELVTPKLTGQLGIRYFTMVWYGIIMGNNLVYSVNSSQGLHTNLSHPRMDPLKFVQLWAYCEPVIIQIVGAERRDEMWSMATPIISGMQTYGEDYEMITNDAKFLAVGVKKGNSPRVEVRIRAGSMDYLDITRWLIFCMWMMAISIATPKDQLPKPKKYTEMIMMSRQNKLDLLGSFFGMIKDAALIDFLEKEYNANKEREWPPYRYMGEKRRIIPYVSQRDFGPDVRQAVRRYKDVGCPDDAEDAGALLRSGRHADRLRLPRRGVSPNKKLTS